LQGGSYTVKWHALSVDTHTTEGDFTFQVKGG
jgi:methionine-rich copper-binding protein CopC